MHLNDYFRHQHAYHLSDQQKADLFHRINQKRLQQSMTWRHFSYKRISYATIALTLAFFVFGGVFLEKNGGIDNLFFSSNPNSPTNVHADYIAEIVEFNGEYTIQNGAQTLSSPYLHNDDIVYLKAGSEIIFNLNEGSQAKLIGPAEFFLTQSEKGKYTIHLIEGKFFTIYNQTTNHEIEIIADDIAIHSQKNQLLNLQIVKGETEILIKNNGSTTQISTTKNNQTVEKTLAQEETISIKNNDINTLTDATSFTDFLARNNISETLSLSNPTKTTPIIDGEQSSGSATDLPSAPSINIDLPDFNQIFNTDSTTNTAVNEEIKSDFWRGNELKIPTSEQNDTLNTILNSFFLTNNFEKLYRATTENNTNLLIESTKELANKMNTLAKSFSIETKTLTNLPDIKSFALELKNSLEKTHYIAPSHLSHLEIIMHRCDYLSSLTPDAASREDFSVALPSQLQFNKKK